MHLIESAISRPYSGYHRSIARKSAALLHSVATNHGFVDGNKRTAWFLAMILIERSGYALSIDDNVRVDDRVVDVASGDLTLNEIADWFTRPLVRG